MIEAEEKGLDALSRDLAATERTQWEPGCVVRAFATPAEDERPLTMQRWIDLSAVRSPLLDGRPLETVDDVAKAARVFGLYVNEETPAEELALVASGIERAYADAFETRLAMNPPEGSEAGEDEGFGDWLVIFSCLVTEIKRSEEAALGMRVDRALALISSMRSRQGWTVAGMRYAHRDVESPKEEAADV